MHFIIVDVEIPEAKKTEFTHAMNELLSSVYSSKKIKSGIFQDIVNSCQFRYWEEWKSLDKMKTHLNSDVFRSLLGGMKVLGKIIDAKTIQSDEVIQLE